jgi:hypothetical protein
LVGVEPPDRRQDTGDFPILERLVEVFEATLHGRRVELVKLLDMPSERDLEPEVF